MKNKSKELNNDIALQKLKNKSNRVTKRLTLRNNDSNSQSERIKNKKLGIILPKIDFDKLDAELSVLKHKCTRKTKTSSNIIESTLDEQTKEKNSDMLKTTVDSTSQNIQSTSSETNTEISSIEERQQNPLFTNNEILNKQLSTDSGNIKDKVDNLSGAKYNLAKNNTFKGQLIAVLQLCYERGYNFKLPEKVLKSKGFKVHLWLASGVAPVPPIKIFKEILEKSCQLWILSGNLSKIDDEHLEVIKEYFDSGKGVYIWGENDPWNIDANKVAGKLFNGKLSGNLTGGCVCGLQAEYKKSGLIENHLISTGIKSLFEGHTVATIEENPDLEPLFYGSADNLVIAVYNKFGKRAIIDGGFTRLFYSWDSGTARYLKNAAAFLENIEQLG